MPHTTRKASQEPHPANTPLPLPKTYLQPNDNRLQIQNRLPILPQDVQTDLALDIDIRMIDLLLAVDLGRLVGKRLRDRKPKLEDPALVHALIGLDVEEEVEDVVAVGEVGAHGRRERHLGDI